jgi:putative Mn2+ efflux pump MntP
LDFISTGLIAVGLAMDAFAVSISCGFSAEEFKKRHAFRIAFAFGLFQALMPVAGWALGASFRQIIAGFDHWVALGLLGFIGGKMLWESRDSCRKRTNLLDWHILFMMSLATSIDAFAVGLTFALLAISIITPVLIIGLVTFGMSWAGVLLGDKLGCFFGRKVERAGGIVLISIGFKIFIEHFFHGT